MVEIALVFAASLVLDQRHAIELAVVVAESKPQDYRLAWVLTRRHFSPSSRKAAEGDREGRFGSEPFTPGA